MPAAWYNFVGKCPFPELHSLVIPLVGQDLISLLLELDSLEEGKGILQDMGTNSLGHPGPPAIPPQPAPHLVSHALREGLAESGMAAVQVAGCKGHCCTCTHPQAAILPTPVRTTSWRVHKWWLF